MTISLPSILIADNQKWSEAVPVNPRVAMFRCLPKSLQPFLTWLTAQPVPGQALKDRSPLSFIVVALLQTILGAATTITTLHYAPALAPFGMLLTTAGLGLFQVVIFHHCSHGTVFRSRELNVRVGRVISAMLLFKHFDHYKHEHMLHHSHNKLLTEEDEFADFVFNTCRLDAGVSLSSLRKRVLWGLVSPFFHARFTARRIKVAWFSHDRQHNLIGVAGWAALTLLAGLTDQWLGFLLAWVVPVTFLLQAATVGRILCEHSFPEAEIIAARTRDLTAHATSGVFPGLMPPLHGPASARGAAAWAGWWANMLTIQLFVRLVVLVGDAPCHDYHHRKPASKRWTSYIQARDLDKEAQLTRIQTGYSEIWGLFRAIDATLASLSRLPEGARL